MPEGERCVQSVSVSRREASAAYVRIRTSVSVSRSALRRYNVGLLTYADIC